MIKEFVCIVCPNGCELKIDDVTHEISGNKCPRGKQFAIDEITCPKRTICSSCKTIFKDTPLVSCRVSNDIPKDKIFDVMKEINKIVIDKRLGIGDVAIKNVLGLDADVIITSNILKEDCYEQ